MTEIFPSGFRSDFVDCDGLRFHVVHNGEAYNGAPLKDHRKPILMLHGFPEFWIAWETVMEALDNEYLIVVPDQRGYNKTDAPSAAAEYKARLLVKDMLTLTTNMLGEKTFSIAGHDWGASIAYALAINFPERVDHLLIANGVHPICFQNAMIDHPEQAEASAYFHILRSDEAAAHMHANDFAKTFFMFEKFSLTPWLNEKMKDRYRNAWSDENRLAAMLHWYNSSPIIVPQEGKAIPPAPLYNADPNQFRVSMPHTLIWGLGDQALMPVSQEHLGTYCDDLRRIEVSDADHWILHTHGPIIADALRELIG